MKIDFENVIWFFILIFLIGSVASAQPDGYIKQVETCTYNKLAERISELERKVKGMQNQITVLHAKKADRIKFVLE